ncbi:MAG TPA: hypothetical protein VFD33_07980 [Bacillota bacterium]|nr:hypothetical protein [Bacillota bacterium]
MNTRPKETKQLVNFLKSLKRARVRNIEIDEMPAVGGEGDFTLIKE